MPTPLPPWLNINPGDFVHAIATGTAAGQSAASAAQRQWESEQKLKLEERQIEAARQQHKAQLDALTQYRLSELGLGRERLGVEKGREAESMRHNLADEALGAKRVDEAMQRLKDLQERGAAGLEIKKQLADLAEQRAADMQQRTEDMRNRPHYVTDPRGRVIAITPEGANQVYPTPKPPAPETHPIRDFIGNLFGSSPSSPTSALKPPLKSPIDMQSGTTNRYKVGARYGKLIYKGGDPNDEGSWQNAE